MTDQGHDAPETEGVARAAQLAAMSITVLEAVAHLHAQRIAERAMDDERAASAARAQRLADHASARVAWTPAYDDDWVRKARTQELGRAWAAATPWVDTDNDAHEAAQRVERRLHELHPDAMAAYHEARAAGAEPAEAMREASPLFARPLALETTVYPSSRSEADASRGTRTAREVAAEGYPLPTSEAVARAHQQHGHAHVITTVPKRARQSASR